MEPFVKTQTFYLWRVKRGWLDQYNDTFYLGSQLLKLCPNHIGPHSTYYTAGRQAEWPQKFAPKMSRSVILVLLATIFRRIFNSSPSIRSNIIATASGIIAWALHRTSFTKIIIIKISKSNKSLNRLALLTNPCQRIETQSFNSLKADLR